MVNLLQTNEPRRALHAYKTALESPGKEFDSKSLDGLLWLFFAYRLDSIALEAINATHKAGYEISTAIACKVLRSAYSLLISDPQKAALAVEWLQEGIMKEGGMQEGTAETLMEVMKRLGKTDWVVEMFLAYRKSLDEGVVGGERVWSIVISAVGEDGNLVGAREWFDQWRTAWRTKHAEQEDTPVPERPYLALLDQLVTNTIPPSAIPYLFLPLLQRDNVPLSTPIFNSLLRLELSRRQYLSFWGLWEKMGEGNWRRDSTSWKLALQAKKREDLGKRGRTRLAGSRLQAIAGYADKRSWQYREIYAAFLRRHQLDTNHRPSLLLPTSAIPIMSSSLLNEFLSSFVRLTDWTAAILILDTFRVMNIEPDEETHGVVVTGIVRAWERGRIKGEREFERGLGVERERRIGRRGGVGAMKILEGILARRKMRIALWTTTPSPSYSPSPPPTTTNEGEDKWTTLEQILNRPIDPPAWMKIRELRDLGYLQSLMRICAGIPDELDWELEMRETRRELLPMRKRETREVLRRERELEGV